MQKLIWKIADTDIFIYRYCSNCKRVVPFYNSNKFRRNSNGKNLHTFIIYKCSKNHTWNKKVVSINDSKIQKPGKLLENHVDEILWYDSQNTQNIEIHIKDVIGRFRFDKLLSNQIQDLTRKKVTELIRLGRILCNNRKCKPKILLKKGDIITLFRSKKTNLNNSDKNT